MSKIRLPGCIVQYPSCGACGDEITHDGDSFYCGDCSLDYGNGDEDRQATYRDEEADPCGESCNNSYHGKDRIKDGWSYQRQDCSLPSGHISDHWNPCDLFMEAKP